jgi:hypothetical protein
MKYYSSAAVGINLLPSLPPADGMALPEVGAICFGSQMAATARKCVRYGTGQTNANAALDHAIGRLDSISDPDSGTQNADVGTGDANSGDTGTVLEQFG